MPEITAQLVKELRDQTGAGMMDAKMALSEAEGDMETAMELLVRKGLTKAAERSDRDSFDGAIALAKGENACALLYLGSETDFSAKAEDFVGLANKIAQAVLKEGLDAVGQFEEELDQLKIRKKENIEIKRVELIEAAEGNSLDTYLHIQDERGINAVIVEGQGVDSEALHQISLHIAFAKPAYLSKQDIPEEDIQTQKQLAMERAKEEGKPEQALEKIATGRLEGWLKERVLLEQGLHGDKLKVSETLGGGSIVKFAQAYIR